MGGQTGSVQLPGVKNTVADALSREPFIQSCVGHRLLKEPNIALLDEVNGVVRGTVQDDVRLFEVQGQSHHAHQ